MGRYRLCGRDRCRRRFRLQTQQVTQPGADQMSNVESLPEPRRSRAIVAATPLDAVNLAIKSGNVEIVAQGFALFKEMRALDGLIAFNNAMADAKAKFPAIVKNREVDFT